MNSRYIEEDDEEKIIAFIVKSKIIKNTFIRIYVNRKRFLYLLRLEKLCKIILQKLSLVLKIHQIFQKIKYSHLSNFLNKPFPQIQMKDLLFSLAIYVQNNPSHLKELSISNIDLNNSIINTISVAIQVKKTSKHCSLLHFFRKTIIQKDYV